MPSLLPPRPARSATARSSSSASTAPCVSAPAKPTPRPSDPAHPTKELTTMKLTTPIRAGLAAAVLVAVAFLTSFGASAEEAAAAPMTFNKGDNAWMLTSSVLVLLMTIPGLALFYGGLARSKNMLSVLAHVFYTVCIVTVIWVIYGYSLAFTGGSAFLGGVSKAFLSGVNSDAQAATFSVGVTIHELI